MAQLGHGLRVVGRVRWGVASIALCTVLLWAWVASRAVEFGNRRERCVWAQTQEDLGGPRARCER